MSAQGYILREEGTPITWKASGGTYALTGTSVADGNGRQGAKGDLGQYRARRWRVKVTVSVAVAVGSTPTTVDVYWGPSNSGTAGSENPGGLSGTDATFNTTPAEYAAQLLPIGSVVLSNNAATGVQTQYFEFEPPARYGMPVIVNSSGQALGGTAGDHTITLTPILDGSYTTSTG